MFWFVRPESLHNFDGFALLQAPRDGIFPSRALVSLTRLAS
jgi:hypothetical protein